jgi:hypothetical protein
LNQRPHPYQQSGAERCADRRFPRSPSTVSGAVMRSNNLTRTADGRVAIAACNVCDQPIAGKAMGLPGGAAAPSGGCTCEVSGGLPNPAARAPGGQHDQAGDQRQDRGQHTDRRDEPVGLPARFGRPHRGRGVAVVPGAVVVLLRQPGHMALSVGFCSCEARRAVVDPPTPSAEQTSLSLAVPPGGPGRGDRRTPRPARAPRPPPRWRTRQRRAMLGPGAWPGSDGSSRRARPR